MLVHAHDDCTGIWRLSNEVIRCTACGRIHPADAQTRIAAMDENFCGRLLSLAADRGSTMLEKERAT